MFQRRLLSFLILCGLLPLAACGGNQSPTPSTSVGEKGERAIAGSRLETVKKRGKLICGINGEVPGFSFVDEQGKYSGMDVDFCRAIASALFNDPDKVEFRKLSAQERFTALQSGEIDVLSRNTTWTLSRDTANGMEFAPTLFYDGQGVMVTKASGLKSLADLGGKSICVLSGTTTEQNLADQMRKAGIKSYNPVVSDDVDALYAAYQQGRCEAVTSDRSQLIARRSVLPDKDKHVVLDLVLSKEPLGPVVANGDAAWFDTVKWIAFSLIQAEEFGITAQNIATFDNTTDPNIRRFLGLDEKLGEDMGLTNDFVARTIRHVGNYGEIYDRNIGKPLGLARGPNNLWTKGGLLFSPPFR